MAAFDPSELLSHASWLRQLARSLARESADDLVQDTWLAAMRRPPRSERSLRPWLRTVLTNAARLRWRGDAHRSAREQVAATLDDRDAASAAELLERHELQLLLARLVSELDEPFRSTILLRFAEGLTPTQIARRLAIPAGTVRWRLKEALERLRVQLDSLHRGDRRAWVVALAPLGIPRSSAAAPIVPIVVTAAAACALFVLAMLTLGGTPTSPATSAPRGSASVVNAPLRSQSALLWLAQEGVPARSLTGRVLLDGVPTSGALVRLIADPLPSREIRTDANGRFDFGEQMPREYVLGAALPGKLAAIRRIDLRDPAAPRDVDLALQACAASLYGKVVDASGAPIEGAQVLREGVVGTETDRNGSYELCVLPTAALVAELRIVVLADGFGTLAIPLAAPGRMHQDFALAPEATVVGRVMGPDGSPIAGARVTLELTDPESSVPPERGVSVTALTEGDGRFRIAGLATGEYRIGASTAHAVALPVAVTVAAAESRNIELRALSTGVVRGRVVRQGHPVAGVTIAAGVETAISQSDGSFVLERVPIGDVELGTAPYRRTSAAIHVVEGDRNSAEVTVESLGTIRGTVRRHGEPVPYARVDINGPSKAGLTTDATGRYEARGLDAGKYAFYCDDRRRGAMATEDWVFELGPAETREHDIDLAWGGTISGRVVNRRGDPVAGVTARFLGGMASHCLTDAAGTFACGSLAGGTYKAAVFPTSGAANPFQFVETPPTFELRDGDAHVDGVRLIIEPTLLTIEGRVVDGAGLPIPDVLVHALGADRKTRRTFQMPPGTLTDEDGRFHISELSPGDYSVEVESRGLATRQTVAAGATNVALVLDRSPCDAARGHELPVALVKPPAPVVWNHQIELVGWSVAATANVGAPIEMTLVYCALKAVDRDWSVFAHFDSATLRTNADHTPGIGWCPTPNWKAGETIVDRVPVQFEQPGRYVLRIGFFMGSAPNWENLALSSAATMEDTTQHGVRITEVLVK